MPYKRSSEYFSNFQFGGGGGGVGGGIGSIYSCFHPMLKLPDPRHDLNCMSLF